MKKEILHSKYFPASIGYQDGYVFEKTLPKAYRLWSVENKLIYHGAYLKGWITRWRKKRRQLMRWSLRYW